LQDRPAVPRGQYISASQQNKADDPREALRAAIQQAKKDAEKPVATISSIEQSAPARSPAEILRERKGPDTRAATEGNAPQKPASSGTVSHGHLPQNHPHKSDRIVPSHKERPAAPPANPVNHTPPEKERGESMPPHPKHNHDHPPAPRDQDNGEISNEVLRRVLHPDNKEADE